MDIPITSPAAASEARPLSGGEPQWSATDPIRLLEAERCYSLLTTTTVGRVAFSGSRGLQLIPVNYRMFEGDVIVRTSPWGTISELGDFDGEVLFEVDHHGSLESWGWSVLLRCTSIVATDPAFLSSPELARLTPWAPGSHSLVLRLHPHAVTGREVDHHATYARARTSGGDLDTTTSASKACSPGSLSHH